MLVHAQVHVYLSVLVSEEMSASTAHTWMRRVLAVKPHWGLLMVPSVGKAMFSLGFSSSCPRSTGTSKAETSSLSDAVSRDLCFWEPPHKHGLFEQRLCVLGNTVVWAAVCAVTPRLSYQDTQREFWQELPARKMPGSCKSICMHSFVWKRKLCNWILCFSCTVSARKFRPKLRTPL